ncbi:MAG: methyltransferase domain-containing protein [bacterium]
MNEFSQSNEAWQAFWDGITPETEIRMWDFYGLRPWILKYIPRRGKVIEAGCGLGRYVFYLRKLGIDIDGIDFHVPTMKSVKAWADQKGLFPRFVAGNVRQLPYQENSISGYLSLGVMEHFVEGPKAALDQVYRVLRPGGIAIITTPSVSFSILYKQIKKQIKTLVSPFIKRYRSKPTPFFQYWYRPGQLRRFVKEANLYPVGANGADLLYAFYELGGFRGDRIKKNRVISWFCNTFENTFVSNIGAQSVTVSLKVEELMYCFLCGEFSAEKGSLKDFDVPICRRCASNRLSAFYRRYRRPRFNLPYTIAPPYCGIKKKNCEYCGATYETDPLFEDFGFSRDVCQTCLIRPDVNLILSNRFVKPIWRDRVIF